MQNRLEQLVDGHAKRIAAEARVLLEQAFADVRVSALPAAQKAVANIDHELADLNRRWNNQEVPALDYKRATKHLLEKRSQAVTAVFDTEMAPKLLAGEQQLREHGGPTPIAPGELFAAAPLAQMLTSLAPTERPALIEGVLLSYATDQKSPVALLPLLRSALDASDLKTNGLPTGPVWSRLFDLASQAETLSRTAGQVAAIAAPDAARQLRGEMRTLATAYGEPEPMQNLLVALGQCSTLAGCPAPQPNDEGVLIPVGLQTAANP